LLILVELVTVVLLTLFFNTFVLFLSLGLKEFDLDRLFELYVEFFSFESFLGSGLQMKYFLFDLLMFSEDLFFFKLSTYFVKLLSTFDDTLFVKL